MKKVMKILLICVFIWILIFITDFLCIKIMKRPIFMIRTLTYKDGGTKEYYGLGYKVIKYNTLEGDTSIHIGTYFIKYNPTISDGTKFSKEYTNITYDNPFIYKDINEIINILKHGTGVIYLGFPECPWCQAYTPMLNDVAKEVGVREIYYFNILNERKNNTDKYKEIVSVLSDYLQYDKEGNKRVYVPVVIAVNKGKIVGFDDETSLDTHNFKDPSLYWTDEEITDLKTKLRKILKSTLVKTCTNCNE